MHAKERLANDYSLKAWSSVVLLMPAIYLTAIGRPCYKRESFALVAPLVPPGAEHVIVQDDFQRVAWNIEACCSIKAALAVRTQAVSARSLLCLLNGITYNVEPGAEDRLTSPLAQTFVTEIAALRSDWMTLGTEQRHLRLAAVRSSGETVLDDLLVAYGSLLSDHWQVTAGLLTSLRIPGTRITYRFDGEQMCAGREARMVWLPPSIGPYYAILSEPGRLDHRLKPTVRDRSSKVVSASAACLSALTRYCHSNAEYVQDVARCRIPFMVLNAGTLCFATRSLWREVPRVLSDRLSRLRFGTRRLVPQ